MPFIHIQVAAAPAALFDDAALAREFTRLGAEVLHKNAAVTAVRIERVAPESWFVGARSPYETRQSTAHVQIQVTQGTNTEAEKAAFVAAAFERLATALGPLHPASYVVVEEIAATGWGYGGWTQAARRLDAPQAARVTAAAP